MGVFEAGEVVDDCSLDICDLLLVDDSALPQHVLLQYCCSLAIVVIAIANVHVYSWVHLLVAVHVHGRRLPKCVEIIVQFHIHFVVAPRY